MVEAGAWIQILALALPLPSSGNSLKSARASVPHVCTGANISVCLTQLLWDATDYCASGTWNIPCVSVYYSDLTHLQVPSLPSPEGPENVRWLT